MEIATADHPTRQTFLPTLLFFVFADILFFAFHVLHASGLSGDPVFSLEGDRVGGEFFQYIKEYWIAFASVILYLTKRQPVFLAWAAGFAYIMLDDSLKIHERAGKVLADRLELPSIAGLLPLHTGQLLFAAVCATVLMTAVGVLFLRADAYARRISIVLVLGLVGVGVFGVGVDLLHALFDFDIFIVIEEAGELLGMSAICAFMISEAFPVLQRWSKRA